MKDKNQNICLPLLGLALVLLLTSLHADALPQWSDTGNLHYFDQTPPTGWRSDHNWLPIALLAITMCVLFNTLVYVLGRVFSLPNVQRFAQAEFLQVTASALMIVGILFMLQTGFDYIAAPGGILPSGTTILCNGASQDVYHYQQGPMSIVQCKLQEKISYVQSLYDQAWANNAAVEPLTTNCYYLLGVPVYCFDWDSALHAKMEQSHYLANKLVPLGISLAGQFMFVQYLANNMLAVFLPIGLILRIFPFLRGIGGLMIAIAIGFYFVFPIAYILLDPSTVRPSADSIIPSGGQKLNACYNTFSGMVTSLTQSQLQSSQPAPGATLPTAQELGAELAKLQIEGFFNPLAALAAALMFISIAAPLLGGDSGEIMHFLTKVI